MHTRNHDGTPAAKHCCCQLTRRSTGHDQTWMQKQADCHSLKPFMQGRHVCMAGVAAAVRAMPCTSTPRTTPRQHWIYSTDPKSTAGSRCPRQGPNSHRTPGASWAAPHLHIGKQQLHTSQRCQHAGLVPGRTRACGLGGMAPV